MSFGNEFIMFYSDNDMSSIVRIAVVCCGMRTYVFVSGAFHLYESLASLVFEVLWFLLFQRQVHDFGR